MVTMLFEGRHFEDYANLFFFGNSKADVAKASRL